jgi:hypothetical protein
MGKWLLIVLLSVLSPLAWADALTTQQISEVDTRSHLLCASAMVYFNPSERNPEPQGLNTVFFHLNTLEYRIQQLGQPKLLTQPLQIIKRLFKELEATPNAQRERYPEQIGQLLEQQQKLLRGLQTLAEPTDSSAPQPLNSLSQALARLSLDYQLRHYPLHDGQALQLPPAQLQALDSMIEQDFETLLAAPEGHSDGLDALSKLRSNYHFVRATLQKKKGRAQGGIDFYLGRMVLDLDEMAMLLAEVQP